MAEHYPIFSQEELANEIWKPVVGFELYYSVSNLGRVRRDNPIGGTAGGKILKPGLRSSYPFVTLSVENKKHNACVHQLVARAFFGEPPIYEQYRTEINHKDKCRINNRLGNLEYCSRVENIRHQYLDGIAGRGERNGTHTHPEATPRGENHGNSRLTESLVKEARERYRVGDIGVRPLAKLYGMSRYAMRAALRGETWAHVK